MGKTVEIHLDGKGKTVEKMTVHKALSEIKVSSARIEDAIANGTFCGAKRNSSTKVGGVDLEEVKRIMQGSYDRVIDLIRRTNALKRAVSLSNATTDVKIGDETMKVAEAIFLKNNGTEYVNRLLEELKSQLSTASRQIDRSNGDLDVRAEKHIESMFGNLNNRDAMNCGEDIESTRNIFIENNTYVLVDEIKIKEKIEAIQAGLLDFVSEIDSALSVSNAITNITIEY